MICTTFISIAACARRVAARRVRGRARLCGAGNRGDAEFIAAPTRRSSPSSRSRPRGGEQFGDPALDGLIERALADDLDLKIAAARVEESRALLGAARRDRWPGVGRRRSRAPRAMQQQPGFTHRSRRRASSYDAGLAALWELDLFGRVRRGVEAAGAEADAAGGRFARRAGARRGRGRAQLPRACAARRSACASRARTSGYQRETLEPHARASRSRPRQRARRRERRRAARGDRGERSRRSSRPRRSAAHRLAVLLG